MMYKPLNIEIQTFENAEFASLSVRPRQPPGDYNV